MVLEKELIENVSKAVPFDSVTEPILGAAQSFFSVTAKILGGIFGLYVLYFLIKWYYGHKIVKEIKSIKAELQQINKELGESRGMSSVKGRGRGKNES